MNVTICEDCQAKINPIDTVEIMDSVKKGWVFERDTLAKNNEPLKDEHSETYQYKYIVERRDVPWNRETIIEAVYAEEIAAGEELARERGISL